MFDDFELLRTIVSRMWLILKTGKVELRTEFFYSKFE